MLDTQEVSGSSPLPHTTVDRRKNFWGFVYRIVRAVDRMVASLPVTWTSWTNDLMKLFLSTSAPG